MAERGRPKIEIDEDKVFKLAQRLWPNTAIAHHFDIHVDTLRDNYSTILEKGRAAGKMFLNDKLMELASRGNLGALVWLTKQHLGWSEKVEAKTEDVTPNRTITIELHRDENQNQLGTKDATPIEIGPVKSSV